MGTIESLVRAQRLRATSRPARPAVDAAAPRSAGASTTANAPFDNSVVVPFRRRTLFHAPAEPQFGAVAACDWQSDYSPELP